MRCDDRGVTGYLLDGKERDRLALRTLEQDYSYGQLQDAACAISRYLGRVGASRGDRALLAGPNSFFWVGAYLGMLRARVVCVPLPAGISPKDFEFLARVTEARVVFAEADFALKHRTRLRGVHLVTDRDVPAQPGVGSQHCLDDIADLAGAADTGAFGDPGDLAALMFTSGSTGRPRGVMVSHANIMANTDSIVEYLGLMESDRMMTVLPFHYCFGTSLLHTHLRVGGSLVLDPRFIYPELVLDRMIAEQCTGFAGVPSHFQILLRRSSLRTRRFPSLRLVQQAGGHLAPSFLAELQTALPDTQIYVMYGQTEATARLSYLPPALLGKKMGSIGRGIPGVVLRVLNDSGEEVRPGEIGEIVAEGANIAAGYWRAPEDTQVSFRDGGLYTGDLARVDEEGFIYVVDRSKEFLKCGGRRVGCRQLEEELLEFEGLVEAAVIGIADEVLGEAAKAFVVVRENNGAGLEERLLAFCRARMSPESVPREIVVVRALPKNSAGKVLKQNLQAGLRDTWSVA